MLTRIHVADLHSKYPLAFAEFGGGLTEDEIEGTDYNFYVREVDGALFCESHDEQMAFKWVGDKWDEVHFPVNRAD